MKFLSRQGHVAADILLIIFFLGYPWLFIETPWGSETIVLFVTGITLLCYSLLTKYEMGVFKFINMKTHLSIDFVLGLMLACTPWLLEFGGKMIFPHLIAGLVMMLLAVVTQNQSIHITAQEKTITF